MEVELSWTLDGEQSAARHGPFTPGDHCVEGWVGP